MKWIIKALGIIAAIPTAAVLLGATFFTLNYQYQVRAHDSCIRATHAIEPPDTIAAFDSCVKKRFSQVKKPEKFTAILEAEGFRCHYYPYENYANQHGKDAVACHLPIAVHPLATEEWVVSIDYERNRDIERVNANIWRATL